LISDAATAIRPIELAKRGAKLVIGVDIREEVLDAARRKASGLRNVRFLTPQRCPRGSADYVISLDSFEHFANPCAALDLINDPQRPAGNLLSSFGPRGITRLAATLFRPSRGRTCCFASARWLAGTTR
jgi:2-polyprenyl-3-methyl-5-hydroxy-6-metoxy-1,4-benzoquinol methylase